MIIIKYTLKEKHKLVEKIEHRPTLISAMDFIRSYDNKYNLVGKMMIEEKVAA